MGINFHVGDYKCDSDWSYTSFHEFRKKVARSIGIDLEEMDGFSKKHIQDSGYIKIGVKSWDSIKSPLKNFLSLCDSNGKIDSEKCNLIAPILKVILVLWEDDDFDIYKKNGFSLIAAMEHCGQFKKDLFFS